MCSFPYAWMAVKKLFRNMTHSSKGVQSGESASRTGQDSEVDPALTDPTPAGASAAAARGRGEADEEGGGLTTTTTHGVNVAAVVPSARPLDQTTDSNTTTTTWDESITPRPPAADSTCDSTPRPQEPPGEEEEAEKQGKEKQEKEQEGEQEKAQVEGDRSQGGAMEKEGSVGRSTVMAEVKVHEEEEEDAVVRVSRTGDERPRPKLTASNSGADIMLGLETEEGQSAEVEIDTADQDELIPEAEVPKGRVRKASITEKVIKTKASEAMAALIKEEAESRQREFEKLLDEHAELVQEISRTPSSENLIQGERDH